MFKILADSRWTGCHGIGRYADEILKHVQTDPVDSVGSSSSPKDPWFLRQQIQKYKPDLFYSPGYNPPVWTDTPFIFTVLDLMHLDIPEESSLAKKLYYQMIIKPAVHRAYRVMTISEYSKQRIVEWSGVNPDKVIVTYCGLDTDYFSHEGEAHHHKKPYFFYCGNQRAHKNLPRLLQAFSAMSDAFDVDLLLSGKKNDELFKQAQSLGIADRVIFTGFISEEDLPKYYRGAQAIVVPSTCEGFGFPALEGFSAGRVVVTSDITAIPEVVDDQAILVDPFSIDSITMGLRKALSKDLYSDAQVDARVKQAKKFPWSRVVEIVSATFDQAEHDLKKGR